MNRWLRLFRHRWLDGADARRALPAPALERVEAAVVRSEQGHSGEIRVCIEAGLPLAELWRGTSARDRALALFGQLRVWDTEQNNGVLLYLLLAEHRIELIADRGIDRRVPAAQWKALVDRMGEALRGGAFEAGLLAAIGEVDKVLAEHFALDGDGRNPNELPDAPVLLL